MMMHKNVLETMTSVELRDRTISQMRAPQGEFLSIYVTLIFVGVHYDRSTCVQTN